MTITKDQIVFTVADFAGFSEPVKKALAGYLEDYAAYFSSVINVSVSASLRHAKTLAAQAPSVANVLVSYATADEAKRAEAEPLLADLENLLKAS